MARRSVLRRTWSTVGDELIAHYNGVLGEHHVTSSQNAGKRDVGVATSAPGSIQTDVA
jgi:hypothetical protein